ncbi:phBC6A51 family helix-turn-helix protein [Bacillus paralicheniformis]|uniref:phBC6A51 family helix-turn-helix protein n=1 Tax=Bacillus paralicheniformis TaxID=1648923 RepID=UPI002DBA5578|nr:phBC6A51 family helix-turn-helix protein [Bacillus paralicheniformis]MEC1285023.1 phBC6A51 family helix-turn-helix protein [Bacillus paralicheniformis]MEC1329807.1 phBC6A51 family helix-turn-helix protein [Bacillus paralicheniformis]
MSRLKELEAKLTLQQRKAALLLVENELMAEARKTQEELAKDIGADRVTVYRWWTQNKAFIEYMNLLADDMLSGHRSEVYSQLMKLIRSKNPSVKAIDLFFRRHGLLTDRQVVATENEGGTSSNEDIAQEIKDIDELLNDGNE